MYSDETTNVDTLVVKRLSRSPMSETVREDIIERPAQSFEMRRESSSPRRSMSSTREVVDEKIYPDGSEVITERRVTPSMRMEEKRFVPVREERRFSERNSPFTKREEKIVTINGNEEMDTTITTEGGKTTVVEEKKVLVTTMSKRAGFYVAVILAIFCILAVGGFIAGAVLTTNTTRIVFIVLSCLFFVLFLVCCWIAMRRRNN